MLLDQDVREKKVHQSTLPHETEATDALEEEGVPFFLPLSTHTVI